MGIVPLHQNIDENRLRQAISHCLKNGLAPSPQYKVLAQYVRYQALKLSEQTEDDDLTEVIASYRREEVVDLALKLTFSAVDAIDSPYSVSHVLLSLRRVQHIWFIVSGAMHDVADVVQDAFLEDMVGYLKKRAS